MKKTYQTPAMETTPFVTREILTASEPGRLSTLGSNPFEVVLGRLGDMVFGNNP